MFTFDLFLLLITSAFIYFILGAFWYSPIGFGKPWMRAVGLTKETMDPNHNMIRAMIISYLVCLAQSVSDLFSCDWRDDCAFLWPAFCSALRCLYQTQYGANVYRPRL